MDETRRTSLLAPPWHTALVVLLFVVLAVAGATTMGRTPLGTPQPSHGPLYISMIAAEIGLIYLVRFGLSKRGTKLSDVIGKFDNTVPSWLRDIVLAALIWAVWIGVEIVAQRMIKGAPEISGLIPHSAADKLLWIPLSIAAGIAEEITFRGYLLRQFRAMTGNAGVALVLQAAVFSIAHGYEGLSACLSIAVFGIMFGLVAMKTGNLRACIVAHAWTDIAAGLL